MARQRDRRMKVPQPTKLRGVTNRNRDKSERQDHIALCRSGQMLGMEDDPERPIIWAVDAQGNRLGYLTAERSDFVKLLRRQDFTPVLRVLQVTGHDQKYLGINVEIDISSVDRSKLRNRRLLRKFVGCLINIAVFVGLIALGVYLLFRFAQSSP